MRAVRPSRDESHFRSSYYVQGNRLVCHRLLGQAKTSDRRCTSSPTGRTVENGKRDPGSHGDRHSGSRTKHASACLVWDSGRDTRYPVLNHPDEVTTTPYFFLPRLAGAFVGTLVLGAVSLEAFSRSAARLCSRLAT